MTVTTVRVAGRRGHPVLIGDGVTRQLAEHLPQVESAAVVYPGPHRALAEPVLAALRTAGITGHAVPVPDGEAAKDLAVAAEVYRALGAAGVTRNDVVVGVGGGATTDLAGFVAATWLRGVRLALVPTTLLGMVDAAVGGKTAVNTAHGKNQVGAFHQPVVVLCDLDTLRSLPPPLVSDGLAEVVKAGFVGDPALLDLLEAWPVAPAPTDRRWPEVVTRAIRVKAAVVGADPEEAGPREMLNYGHTLGHAIESVEGFRWSHGAAVSVGMVFAAGLGRHSGRLGPDVVDQHRRLLGRFGLPVRYRRDAWPRLRAAMAHDKKARGGRLRFVVLDGPGRPGILEDPDPELLAAAYREVAR